MDQIVTVLSDILLGAGALGAAVYCSVLANRLKRFNNLENGMGGAVALLSAQVDDMTRTLDLARKAAGHSSETLTALTERAETASRKLELMLAALNDLPDATAAAPTKPAPKPAVSPASDAQEVSDGGSDTKADPKHDPETEQDADWAATAAAAQPDEEAPQETPLFLSRRARAAGAAQ